MPCYSYTSGSLINYVGNVEQTYNVSGVTYSYSAIAWLCEVPVQDQLCVFTTTIVGGAEAQLTYSAVTTLASQFSISGENIVLHSSAGKAQVIIRRCTNTGKMLFKFTDGAKLTAKQLNASLHQLLFISQEKEYQSAVTAFVLPVSNNILDWNSGTSYTTLNYVTYAGQIWQALLFSTNQTPQAGSIYWKAIEFASSWFAFKNSTPGPLIFNLFNLQIGNALVWNGSEFVAGFITGSLDSLSDVNTSDITPVLGDILVYSTGGLWKNKVPTIDITLANIVFPNFAFTAVGLPNSYTNNNTSISAPSALNEFKNGSSQWVLTTPPTVYHIIKKSLPASADPIDFFNLVNNNINTFAANAGNPIKVKFEWDLGWKRFGTVDTTNVLNLDTLNNYKSMFWDNPNELYAISMWSGSFAASGLKYHGVSSATTISRITPYHYQEEVIIGNVVTTDSKFRTYGIETRGFYLNVPESCSSNLANLPILQGGGSPELFANLGNYISSANLTSLLNNVWSPTEPTVDFYLQGLRDFAFAATRVNPGYGVRATNKPSDAVSRVIKGKMIGASYSTFHDIDYKRLESTTESTASVLWRMPKQMIYYNKVSLALANTTTDQLSTSSDFLTNNIAKQTRFSGRGLFHPSTGSPFLWTNSTVSFGGLGYPFKADAYWADWVTKWTEDPDGGAFENYNFGEADIDWVFSGLTSAGVLNLHDGISHAPIKIRRTSSGGGVITIDNVNTATIYPWTFRPNSLRYLSQLGTEGGLGGTHILNIDANRLFSDADLYIPPPVDEYVYRLVVDNNKTGLFAELAAYQTLKTAIILEWGLSERTNNHSATGLSSVGTASTNSQIYKRHTLSRDSALASARLDKTKLRVYVRDEFIETGTDGVQRLVLNLCITVPRLRYIGYSRIFRGGPNYGIYGGNATANVDSDKDGGPWNFSFMDSQLGNLYGFSLIDVDGVSGGGNQNDGSTNYSAGTSSGSDYQSMEIYTNSGTFPQPIAPAVSGRNECAVKFVRLGIPSTLWIKLSIMNTEGTINPLNNVGVWN